MDLSGVFTSDLQNFQAGNLSAVSTRGLVALHQLHSEAAPVGEDAGAGHAFGEGLANSVPGGQKITSAIGAGTAKAAGVDGSFSDLYDQAQANTAATAKASPYAAGAGTAAGIATSLPIFGAAGKAIGAGADAVLGEKTAGALSELGTPSAGAGYLSRAANLGVRAAKGAAGAAPVGALYGAANDTTGHPLEAAASGAEAAAAIGAGLPVLGAAAGAAADILGPAGRAVASKVAPEYASQLEQNVAMGKVVKRFNADFTDPVQRQAALDAYLKNPDVGLAESAGKNTKNLALGAAQYPSGEAGAQDYFQARTSTAPGRIAKTFADQVSSNQDYFGTLDGITEKGRKAASPLYKTAYEANASVDSPEIDKVLSAPAGKQALGVARWKMLNDLAAMKGVSDEEAGRHAQEAIKMEQMYSAPENQYSRPDVNAPAPPTPRLNLRSLDYVKRALDDQIGAAKIAGERDNERIITGLKNNLLDALDSADQTGAYARARAVSGDYIRNSQAMDDGRNFMKPGTAGQPEQIAANFAKLGPTEQEAYKAGMVRAVKEAMDKPSADQPNFYTKVFGSPDLQNRIKAVLNPSEFEVLSKNMKAEADLYKFKNETLGNSRTAIKQISADEFNSGGQEIMKDLATGGSITRTATKAATQWIGSMFDGLSNKTAGQVAKILYETDPTKKLEIMKSIQNSPGLGAPEKQEAVKAYFSVSGLFKNMAKIQPTIQGDQNAQ